MPKTKKKPPIKGIKKVPKDKLTVVKSNPLTSLWRSELTLAEFKILDTYLARINSHEPDKRQVEITKDEFEKVFGISKFNLKELDARLNHLVGQAVKISDGDYRHGFAYVSLFEEARVEADDNGVQTVYLECTSKAMKYFFNCDNLGYLRYKLQSVKDMKSRYTYVLFLYLEKNRFRTDWTQTLEELKVMLNCESDETYSEFKFFNQKILKRAQDEITEKTNCRFSYVPVKTGRKVTGIHFTVQPLSPEIIAADEPDPEQLQLFGSGEDGTEPEEDLLSDACNGEFSPEEVAQLRSIVVTVPEQLLPTVSSSDSLEIRRYHYLDQRYKTMLAYDSRNKIQNRFKYLLKIISNDVAE